MLNGSKKPRVRAGTKHRTVQRLRGEGPADLAGLGRGDLRDRFVIHMPSDAQGRAEGAPSTQLSKVMNGNPREGLHRRGRCTP